MSKPIEIDLTNQGLRAPPASQDRAGAPTGSSPVPGLEQSRSSTGAKVEVKCQRCKQPFMARVADRKRGWGKFCSKSCKAVKQAQSDGYYSHGVTMAQARRDAREYGGTPQYANNGDYVGFTMSPAELAGGGYGDADWDTPFGDGKW